MRNLRRSTRSWRSSGNEAMTRRRKPTRRRGDGSRPVPPRVAVSPCRRVPVSPLSDPLCPAGRGDKGTDPCQFQLQFLYQGEGALQLRLAAEGFKLGSKRKGALRAEV